MLQRSKVLQWTVMNLKSRAVNNLSGQNIPVQNRSKNLIDAATSKRRGSGVGRGETGGGAKKMTVLAQSFGVVRFGASTMPHSYSHEFRLMSNKLDLPIQHLIVSFQRQIDEAGRREVPQRNIWAHAELQATYDQYWKSQNPARTEAEQFKPIDVGYKYRDAELVTPNRDEVLFRIVEHFQRRGVVVRFDKWYEDPPGLSLHFKWYAEDDARVITPEGMPVPTPRVDRRQKLRGSDNGFIGIGHGQHRTAC